MVQFRRKGKLITRPLTDCGNRFKDESSKWYVQYKDANGIYQRVTGYADKEATRQLAADIERRVERRMSGLADPFDEAATIPLSDHLTQFKSFLLDKGDSKKHVNQTYRRIERCFRGCNFSMWGTSHQAG